MPTPRSHGGAALALIPMTAPGFKGLNTQAASSLLGPEWATKLTNCVLDDNNRVAARKGYEELGGTGGAGRFVDLKEVLKSDGTSTLLAVERVSPVYQYSSNAGATWAGTTTALNMTDGYRSSIVSFNNKGYVFTYGTSGVLGVQWDPSAPTVDTSISDTNTPNSGIVWAAFGRLWGVDNDGHTVRYSALLDGTDWDGTDAGSIDLWNVWSENDEVVGGTDFNGALVIFGRNNIAMWTDGQGSQLGVDPTQLYVFDTMKGVGCIEQHSIQHVNGDVWFLSTFGLQSLGRTIQEKSNPIMNLSKNVQDSFNTDVAGTTTKYIRSAYSPREKLYLLSLPSGGSAETGTCYAFDTRGMLEDGAARCLGEWTLVPNAMTYRRDGSLLMSLNGESGCGTYSLYLDRTAAYELVYESGWMDLTQQGYLLFPKRYEGVFFANTDVTVQYKWAFDFDDTFKTRSKTFTIAGASVWGTAVWGTDLYGGGTSLRRGKIPASGNGEYIKLGLNINIDGVEFAVQQLDLFAKVGRYA